MLAEEWDEVAGLFRSDAVMMPPEGELAWTEEGSWLTGLSRDGAGPDHAARVEAAPSLAEPIPSELARVNVARDPAFFRSLRHGRLPSAPYSGAGSGFVSADRVSRPVPTRRRRRAAPQSQVTDPPSPRARGTRRTGMAT